MSSSASAGQPQGNWRTASTSAMLRHAAVSAHPTNSTSEARAKSRPSKAWPHQRSCVSPSRPSSGPAPHSTTSSNTDMPPRRAICPPALTSCRLRAINSAWSSSPPKTPSSTRRNTHRGRLPRQHTGGHPHQQTKHPAVPAVSRGPGQLAPGHGPRLHGAHALLIPGALQRFRPSRWPRQPACPCPDQQAEQRGRAEGQRRQRVGSVPLRPMATKQAHSSAGSTTSRVVENCNHSWR